MNAVEFWNALPSRRFDWSQDADGRCVVLRPKLGEGRVGRWFAARLGDPCYRIRLDEFGTFVWKACDGQTPLTVIAERLRDEFGDRVEPTQERLGRFVQKMLQGRMIAVDGSPGRPAETGGRRQETGEAGGHPTPTHPAGPGGRARAPEIETRNPPLPPGRA